MSSGGRPAADATQQRLRLDEERCPDAPGYQPAERRQQQPVGRREPRTGDLPTQDRQLVPKDENLELLRALVAREQHDQLEQTAHDDAHQRPKHTTSCERERPTLPPAGPRRSNMCTRHPGIRNAPTLRQRPDDAETPWAQFHLPTTDTGRTDPSRSNRPTNRPQRLAARRYGPSKDASCSAPSSTNTKQQHEVRHGE